MSTLARLFIAGTGILILGFVLNWVRTRRLKEEYAILWLFTGVVLLLLPVVIDLLDAVSYALGITYPPAFVGTIAAVCVLFILFQFSLNISRFSERIKVLTQDLALLRNRVHELEDELAGARSGHGGVGPSEVDPAGTMAEEV